MKDFGGRIAVVTGAGTGMGRELALQLASEGCHVAMCDIFAQTLGETRKSCEELAPEGTRLTAYECDVSDEAQVVAFRDAVVRQHETDHINLVFNNAGIGGGGSFLIGERAAWDKTFGVCWGGVYYCSRAFMPLLVASTEGHIINTSSVNGFWACLGPMIAHTAYSAAKFAVKGFSEALLVDLRLNAPHVKVSLVMPGHIGTSIMTNTTKVLRGHTPEEMTEEELAETREILKRLGVPAEGMSDEQIRVAIKQRAEDFLDKAPVTAGQAATIILDGVREEKWRILVGDDARRLDRAVREFPEGAYEESFTGRLGGALQELRRPGE